jgi:ribosomal protein S24E
MIIRDEENPLLDRREITCIFKDAGGKLSRADAINMLKEKFNIDKFIIPIKLYCESGKRDVKGLFYIYNDKDTARKYLPEHIFNRIEKKEEGNDGQT